MITAYDLIAAIRDPLAESSTVETWCLAAYGRRQIVAVGWDYVKKPMPTDADCPLIVLRPVSESGGSLAATNDIRIAINLALWEARAKSDAPTGTRVPELWWAERMAAFAGVVWTAVKAALVTAGAVYPVQTITTDYQDDAYPLIEALMVAELSAYQLIGASEPTLT